VLALELVFCRLELRQLVAGSEPVEEVQMEILSVARQHVEEMQRHLVVQLGSWDLSLVECFVEPAFVRLTGFEGDLDLVGPLVLAEECIEGQ
jgi:hypothetical protein